MEKVKLKKEHQEILDLISDYLANLYDQRFGQTIFNLGINQFVNEKHPEKEDYKIETYIITKIV